jgi:hypothetical protein
VDWATATRDAARAAGFKAKWFKPKEAVDEKAAQLAEEAQAQQTVQDIGMAGQIAEQSGKGLGALVQAGNMAMQPPDQQPMPMPGARRPMAAPVR